MSTITSTLSASPKVTEYSLILKQALKDHEDIESITDRFAEALQQPEVQTSAVNDIRNLTKTIKEIDAGFVRIGGTFVAFDNAGFLDKDNDKVLQLGPQWREYHERFRRIVEQSHNNAIEASAFMKQFSGVLLTDVEGASYGDLKIELQAFVQKLEQRAVVAADTQNNFSTLSADLRLFESVIENAIDRAGARVSTDLVAARAHLDTLRNQLIDANNSMSSVGEACVQEFTLGAVSAGLALLTLSPVAMYTAVKSVMGGIRAEAKLEEVKKDTTRIESEIEECNARIAALMTKDDLVKKYQLLLTTTKEEIEGLADKIDVIARIWQSLKADMRSLKDQLDLSADPKMPITPFFLKKVRATRELYVTLAAMLDLYAKGSESAD